MSLYDRITEDSRRTPSREREWGTGPASRWDTMSRKLRRRAAIALRRANVHPTKSSQDEIDKALEKDQDFQAAVFKQQQRSAARQFSSPAQRKAKEQEHRARRGPGKKGGDKCWGACVLRRQGKAVRRG